MRETAVIASCVDININRSTQLLRLITTTPPPGLDVSQLQALGRPRDRTPIVALQFAPGKWLDLYFNDGRVCRCSILSAPSAAAAPTEGGTPVQIAEQYVEVVVQNAHSPPMQQSYGDSSSVVTTELQVHVGGSFVWPPSSVSVGYAQCCVHCWWYRG